MAESPPPTFHQQPCWCGNSELAPYEGLFHRCANCETLICQVSHDGLARVDDEESDYYGLSYWSTHQQEDLGLDSISERARGDVRGRALYWLKNLLALKRPPARILEIGSGPGGFVFLCRRVGFEAVGLELSAVVAKFSSNTFDIPVRSGVLADQEFEPESFDGIVLLDVLEHLPDPVTMLARCRSLLKPSGFLMLQTPCFPGGPSRNEKGRKDQEERDESGFDAMLIPREHLFLFSRNSLQKILQNAGFESNLDLVSLFGYDSFVASSSQPLERLSSEELAIELEGTAHGRLALLLIDLFDGTGKLNNLLRDSEADRAARLAQIQRLTALLTESENDRAARLAQIERLTTRLTEAENDQAARFEQIQRLTALLTESENDRAARLEQVEELTALLTESENDRSARLQQVEELTVMIHNIKAGN